MADAAHGTSAAAAVRARPFHPDAAPLGDLAATFADAGFDAVRTERTLAAARVHGVVDRPYLRRLLAEPTPYNTLVHLFLLCEPVPDGRAAAALGHDLAERMTRVGLLRTEAGRVAPMVRMAPYPGLLLASDIRPSGGEATPADHVLGLAPTSDILVRLTPRRRVDTALDLGTGCGIHALLAARHAGRATGTDIGERALAYADLNARINRIDNVEWRRGPFFTPVAGSRFDLIVSNPPFAISPESTYLYRDTEQGGSAVSEAVVTGAARHLAPGGFAVSLVSWYHTADDDWEKTPRGWVADTGCDTWLLRGHSVTPLEYAAFFLRQTELHDPDQYERRLGEWVRYYEDNGMSRLAIGTIILRRKPAGSPWFRADTVPPERIVGDCGAHVETIFRNEDLLHALAADRRLLDQRLRISPHHVLEHRLHVEAGEWLADRSTLSLDEGIISAGSVDAPVIQLFRECDGSRSFGEVVAALADSLGVDVRTVTPRALATARRLLQTGLLERADAPAG